MKNFTANIVLNSKILSTFLLRSEKVLSLLLFNTVWKALASEIWQAKETTGIKFEKEKVKLSLFLDGTIVYVENSKKSKKYPTGTNKCIQKIMGYDVNIQRSIVFVYTSSKKLEDKKCKNITMVSKPSNTQE